LWWATGWFGRGAPGGGRTDAPPRYLTGEVSGAHAFLFAQTIDGRCYERQRDRLREELTLAQIDHHADAVDELDQGTLALRFNRTAITPPLFR